MLKLTRGITGLLSFALLAGVSLGADPEPTKYYKLGFVVKEVEGSKVVNSRSYSMTVPTDRGSTSSIRAGNKVPLGNSFIDIGTNIDCRLLKEIQNDVAVDILVDLTSTAQELSNTGPPNGVTVNNPPVVRQNRWSSVVIVPVGKPTVVFSSDDVGTKHQIQLEVTASLLK
jgi:hypothetical protein